MTTTPTGAPPWVRTTAIGDYGGDANKADYLGIGAINPTTDVSAAQFLRLVSDVAECARTLPKCTLAFTCDDAGAANPTVTAVTGMVWNYSGAGYAGATPPTGYPSVTRISDGQFRVTFASSYTDEFGVSGTFAVNAATPGLNTTSTTLGAVAHLAGSVIVDVYVFTTTTGVVAAYNSGVTLVVW